MYSNAIEKIARKKLKIRGFRGVFPLDALPQDLCIRTAPPYRFIVNTHTNNLPGEHWLAVSYEKGNHILVFDPLGFYYPPKLIKYLAKFKRKLVFNKVPYQSANSRQCGQWCLRWLKFRNANTNTTI